MVTRDTVAVLFLFSNIVKLSWCVQLAKIRICSITWGVLFSACSKDGDRLNPDFCCHWWEVEQRNRWWHRSHHLGVEVVTRCYTSSSLLKQFEEISTRQLNKLKPKLKNPKLELWWLTRLRITNMLIYFTFYFWTRLK